MFRAGPSRDGVYHVDGPPETATQAWTFEAVADAYSSPAVVNGVVYFGGIDEDFGTGAHGEVGVKDVHLYAVDAQTGQERWRFATEGSVFSSPAVADDIVYFGSADAGFYAVGAASGAQLWRFGAEGPIASSPVVADDAVYFTDRDGYLYALDAATGQELWRFRISEREFTAEGWDSWDAGTWSSPAVVDGTVFTGSSDGHVYAVDAVTGAEKWRFKTRGDVWVAPAVANGIVYFGSYDTHLYAVDAATGAEVWRYKTPYRIRSSPAVIRTHRRVRQQGRKPGSRRRGEGRRALEIQAGIRLGDHLGVVSDYRPQEEPRLRRGQLLVGRPGRRPGAGRRSRHGPGGLADQAARRRVRLDADDNRGRDIRHRRRGHAVRPAITERTSERQRA